MGACGTHAGRLEALFAHRRFTDSDFKGLLVGSVEPIDALHILLRRAHAASNRATSVHYGLLFNTCAQALRTPKHEGRNRNLHRPLIMRQTTAQRETEFKQTTDNARPGIRNKR
jgi:hypothetical protein